MYLLAKFQLHIVIITALQSTVITTEQSSIGKINYKNSCNLWTDWGTELQFLPLYSPWNRGMDYWISFSITHPSSLHLKVKFMKKNWSRTIISTWCKQMPIPKIFLGLLNRNKYFPTVLEQANKVMSRFVLLAPSFTKKEVLKNLWNFSTICKYAPNVFKFSRGPKLEKNPARNCTILKFFSRL